MQIHNFNFTTSSDLPNLFKPHKGGTFIPSPAEIAKIETYIATKGVTVCPACRTPELAEYHWKMLRASENMTRADYLKAMKGNKRRRKKQFTSEQRKQRQREAAKRYYEKNKAKHNLVSRLNRLRRKREKIANAKITDSITT